MKESNAEMKAEMQALQKAIKDDTHSWFKMHGRIMYISGGVGLLAFIFAAKCHYDHTQMINRSERTAARALERS